MTTIHRYEVPVDDQWHTIQLRGEVVHVAARNSPHIVEIWARVYDQTPTTHRVRVFGTGHPMPADAMYVGTALIGPFAWHLMEATP